MIIPHQQLAPDTLFAIADEYVCRSGTDYGEFEIPHQRKVEQVILQIKAGDAFILYSELHESCTIISKHEMQQRLRDAESASNQDEQY